ncbi:hypothetical protein T265_01394 [Opisthorchis viverrini]|uniref:Uncharacterized protein n=1 Tax=Opisthorchis viverrini TaxID=6198 RepID=A0A074ZZK7_OPIVI|nr:hypothetical protein T265_01394 [Opisthorchis viverrini]KER32516.1 hypothetical protein T265_01394 [Opisthorchis viverrini]
MKPPECDPQAHSQLTHQPSVWVFNKLHKPQQAINSDFLSGYISTLHVHAENASQDSPTCGKG